MAEPFGTTPLPTSSGGSPVAAYYAPQDFASSAQQPQTQQIALFEASPPPSLNGRMVDVNQHFVVYAVKNGLIRVLHRHSPLKALLRGHKGQIVTDIGFFQDGDVLATAAHSDTGSSVFIWRVFERSPEILSEILLEISSSASRISRILWHPFNPNQFWMMHTNSTGKVIATLVETTRITTTPGVESHACCDWYAEDIIMEGAVQIVSTGSLTDLCWSDRETRHVLTVDDAGQVCLWDLKKLSATGEATVSPVCLSTIDESPSSLSRCLFLPHESAVRYRTREPWTSCFVTAQDDNRVLTLWSSFGPSSKPEKLQVVGVEPAAESYLVEVCSGPAPADASPPSCFLVVADRTSGSILAFHCRSEWNADEGKNKKALLIGCDYVVPFTTVHPTYSWSVLTVPTTDISEEELNDQGGLIFDMKLFCYQPTVVQSVTLTSYMCLPPEHSWTDPTPGVRVERLLDVHSAHVSEIGSDEGVVFDEDYDLGEENGDDDDDEFVDAPEPSALPTPGFSPPVGSTPAPALANNPFANWLGAIASKSTGAPGPVPPPPPPPPGMATMTPTPPPMPSDPTPPPLAVDSEEEAFLSPMDIIGRKTLETTKAGTPTISNRKNEPPKKKAAKTQPQILKRDERAAPAAAAVPSPSNGNDLAREVRNAIREEIQSTVLPFVEKTIVQSMQTSVLQPLQASLARLGNDGVKVDNDALAKGVASSVDEPLRMAMAENMKKLFIPTLESVTSQVFVQISEHLEKGTPAKDSSKELEAISTQLSTMTALVAKLTTEVQTLRTAVAAQKPPPAARAATPTGVVAVEAVRAEILALLKEKKFEQAFTKAVSSSTADTSMSVYCCAHADISEVLGGTSPKVSQPILLCLMQQLGTILKSPKNSNLQLELEWLQEIALSLNPADTNIAGHVPGVLQQLVAGINARMAQNDPALRRPLQRLLQVVRGMQMG